MANSIYRRAAIYWWRRTIYSGLAPAHPITVRASLRTPDLAAARLRAAWLEMELGNVEQDVRGYTHPGLRPEDLNKVYNVAFRAALDRYLVQQAETPWAHDAHVTSNVDHARYFTMIASSRSDPRPGWDLAEELGQQGLDLNAINRIQQIAWDAQGSPISPDYVAAYLQEAGCSNLPSDIERARRFVAAAYRSACIEAVKALGEADPSQELPRLPPAIAALLNNGVEVPISNPPVRPAPPPQPETEQTAPQSGRKDCRISELAEIAVSQSLADGKWRAECRGDVRAVVKLFIAASGDLLLSEIQQHHLAGMAALFSQLPRVYGKLQKGSTRESPIWETVEQALRRGREMQEPWENDPVAAGKAGLPRPGLSVATRNKHLQWIDAIFSFADGHGYVTPDVSTKRLRSKDKRKQNELRLPWLPEELAKLLSGPVWEGSAGITQRLTPGPQIYHDAMYWAPLLLVAHATRSEETNGIMLADVFDEASVPYVAYRDNAYRKLKNGQSLRYLPIPSGLVDLGFLDYVRVLREMGQDLVFPELWNKNQGFDRAFRDKVFYPLLEHHFPSGTSQKRDWKDVDVHSIRAMGLTRHRDLRFGDNERNRFAGHTPVGETDRTYSADAQATLFVDMVAALWEFVPPIANAP